MTMETIRNCAFVALALYGAWHAGETLFFWLTPGSRRFVFWTHTSGLLWRDRKGVLAASRLTDALQDYWTEKKTGRTRPYRDPVSLHEDDY